MIFREGGAGWQRQKRKALNETVGRMCAIPNAGKTKPVGTFDANAPFGLAAFLAGRFVKAGRSGILAALNSST